MALLVELFFFANMSNLAYIPPTCYYLNPVIYLGFDPVSGSRLIAGVNTPQKNFLIMEVANWGAVKYFEIPASLQVTVADTYDGASSNYYNIICSRVGQCSLNTWNLIFNNVSSFPLSCIDPSGFITGKIFLNPLAMNRNILLGLQFSQGDNYKVVTINLATKSCVLSGFLSGLPPRPVIIVASKIGPKSGNLYMSLTSDVYNAINIYDSNVKFLSQVQTQFLFEDLFVHEV